MEGTVVTRRGLPPGDQETAEVAPSAAEGTEGIVEGIEGAEFDGADVEGIDGAAVDGDDGGGDESAEVEGTEVDDAESTEGAEVEAAEAAETGEAVAGGADRPESVATPPTAHTTVMLLGAGEMARELAISFQRLGAEVVVVDRAAGGPAHGVADRSVVMPVGDPEMLYELVRDVRPRCVVPLIDYVAADALEMLEEKQVTRVIPTAKAVGLAYDREGVRRLADEELGLPTPAYWFASSREELTKVLELSGLPAVVRPALAPYGQGQSMLLRHDDVEPAWEQAMASSLGERPRVIVETVVEIDHEITLLTVRTAGVGAATRLYFCEPIAHRQNSADSVQAWQPQPMSQPAMELARSIAARIVNALGGHGVYGVELFVRGNEVYFCDVSARPYDTGLVTVRSQRLSEFDLHARAVLGLPIDTLLVSPAAAEVVYGPGGRPAPLQIERALQVPESDLRIFGHTESHRRRRIGVALATAPNVSTALSRAHGVAGFLQ